MVGLWENASRACASIPWYWHYIFMQICIALKIKPSSKPFSKLMRATSRQSFKASFQTKHFCGQHKGPFTFRRAFGKKEWKDMEADRLLPFPAPFGISALTHSIFTNSPSMTIVSYETRSWAVCSLDLTSWIEGKNIQGCRISEHKERSERSAPLIIWPLWHCRTSLRV